MIQKILFSLSEIDSIVKEHFLPRLKTHKIFTFKGPLGAGKTTLIKSFLFHAGVDQIVTSPTFTYMKSYETKTGKVFNHFDLYRLNSEESFLGLGFEQYLYQENSYSVIEWPGVIEKLLQQASLRPLVFASDLDYTEKNLDKRILKYSKNFV